MTRGRGPALRNIDGLAQTHGYRLGPDIRIANSDDNGARGAPCPGALWA